MRAIRLDAGGTVECDTEGDAAGERDDGGDAFAESWVSGEGDDRETLATRDPYAILLPHAIRRRMLCAEHPL